MWTPLAGFAITNVKCGYGWWADECKQNVLYHWIMYCWGPLKYCSGKWDPRKSYLMCAQIVYLIKSKVLTVNVAFGMLWNCVKQNNVCQFAGISEPSFIGNNNNNNPAKHSKSALSRNLNCFHFILNEGLFGL